MRRIVVTGAAGPLGRRVRRGWPRTGRSARSSRSTASVPAGDRPIDLLADLTRGRVEGATTVVHLASAFGPARRRRPEASTTSTSMARRVLDAAGKAGVGHVVVLSSATVYGAWPNNPVPLTEDAPLRPNPEFAFAVQKAEIERLAWPSGATTTRAPPSPCCGRSPAVAEGGRGWLAGALRAAGDVRGADDDPPVQFLHLDDLAAAVDLACARAARRRLQRGPRRLAPAAPSTAALAGGCPGCGCPAAWSAGWPTWRWRLRLASAPPGLVPYVRAAWVVANDRLRAAGWEPTHSNEEAYVAGHPAGPWATLSPRRRQELALGGAATVLVGAAAGVALVLRRRVAGR